MRSHGSSLWGFPDNILQGWFKMKTTSIFPVHGLAVCNLILRGEDIFQYEAWIYTVVLYMDILQKQIVSI